MRLRNIPGARETIAKEDFVINEPKEHRGKWREVFGRQNPICLEIGVGKGKFIMELAAKNPEINYIGIEKYSSVLLRAVEKQRELELSNVVFVRMEAEQIEEVFAPEEIDRIYLNFSDPWPKDRHAKRRLTSRQFLARYDKILKKDGALEFKTDNRQLFDFSVEETEPAGWHIDALTYDLHAGGMNGENIMTEYEERFSAMGTPINKMVISRGRRA